MSGSPELGWSPRRQRRPESRSSAATEKTSGWSAILGSRSVPYQSMDKAFGEGIGKRVGRFFQLGPDPADPDEIENLEYWGGCESCTRWPQNWLEPLDTFTSPACYERPEFDPDAVEMAYCLFTAGSGYKFSAEQLRDWGIAGAPPSEMAASALSGAAAEIQGWGWRDLVFKGGLTVREWVRLLTACDARSWRMAKRLNSYSENGNGPTPRWMDKAIVHGFGWRR